ncbi:isoprenyl transferase [Sphingobium subterraneum]|nr:isoprenyl transferase [Sphingobium subterraneum]
MASPAPTPAPTFAQEHGARHVAIIMDGNGRWAKKRFLPRVAGHRAGVEAVRKVARAARQMGLDCLTLYAFSSENWKRPQQEIADLTGILKHFIQADLDEFHANNVRLRVIGDYRAFEADAVALIEAAVERTRGNDGSTLAIALNYGAQDEMARAVRTLAARVAAGEVAPDAIGIDHISAALDTADLPPLDLLIRTSGEQRLSNFLLWQAAYAELYFTDMLWPDFDGDALAAALASFKERERRFGGL